MYYLTAEDYRTANQNGIPSKYAYCRYYQYGWSLERALTEPVNRKQSLYAGYQDLCEANGVSKQAFNYRVRKGMDPETAATIRGSLRGHHMKNATGKLTKKDLQAAAKIGLRPGTVQARVYQYKWPVHLAISIPAGTKRSHLKLDKRLFLNSR